MNRGGQNTVNKSASLHVGWRFLLRQFLIAWALAALGSAGWIALNFTGGIPIWSDLLCIAILALGLLPLVKPISSVLSRRRWGRIVTLAYLIVAVMMGISYLTLDLVSFNQRRNATGLLRVFLGLPDFLRTFYLDQLHAAQTSYQQVGSFALTQWLSYLTWPLVVGALIVALSITWSTVVSNRVVMPVALLARLPLLGRIRLGRVRNTLQRGGFALLVLIGITHGVATYSNCTTPYFSDQIETVKLVNGPDAPPIVNTMIFDDKVLYAGTNSGVFVSRDSGASWQAANNGLSNTTVRSLVFGGKLLFAGTYGGGVFVSSDGGAYWQAASTGLHNKRIQPLVFDGKALYAGTDGDGVFVSRDNGASWRAANSDLSNTGVRLLVSDGRALYAGAYSGVYVSRDGGASWQDASTGLGTVSGLSSLIFDGKALYAGTYNGEVFVLRDGGASWEATGAGVFNGSVQSLIFDGKTLYAGTYGDGVFVSRDSGASWKDVNTGLSDKYVRSLVFDGTTLYAGTNDGGVYVSRDEGARWRSISSGLSNASAGLSGTYIRSLIFDSKSKAVYALTNSGVFVTKDGGANWQSASVGLRRGRVSSLAFDGKALYAGTYDDGVFVMRDDGTSWQAANIGLRGAFVQSLIFDGKALYAGIYGNGVFVSRDSGASWQATNNGLSNLSNMNVLSLVFTGKALYANKGSDGMFVSRDYGASWQVAETGLIDKDLQSPISDGKVLYAGTYGNGVFVSQDGGVSWQATSTDLNDKGIQSLIFDGEALYVGTYGNGVFVSRDSGASWQTANNGLSNTIVWSLIFDSEALYAGTDGGGVFVSRDGGASWQAASTGLSSTSIASLKFDGKSLYAKTFGGVYASSDYGASWEQVDPAEQPTQTLHAAPGALMRWSSGRPLRFGLSDSDVLSRLRSWGFNVEDTSDLWTPLPNFAPVPSASGQPPVSYLALPWGATIQIGQMKTPPTEIPVFWLIIRAVADRLNTWLAANNRALGILLAIALGLYLLYRYLTLIRPYRLPPLALLNPQPARYAQSPTLTQYWPEWTRNVRSELLAFGDAIPADLQSVPAPFRHEALARYAQTHEQTQLIEATPNHIHLQAGERPRIWRAAWLQATRAVGRPFATPTRAAIHTLCQSLAQALGLSVLGQPREYQQTLVYRVEAPALRLNVPPRFPLVFVSVAQPSTETVKLLVDAVDVVKEAGYFALVVPLAPPSGATAALNVAAELRRVIAQSPHVHDFIILDNDDALDLLIARQPTDALAQRILAQADLATVSPFQAEGPVNEAMFFGREAEVKTLIEQTLTSDFAIVGNRKIGKTSLLKRSVARLQDDPRSLPLFINCQEVREADEFYTEFARTTQMELTERTPDSFRAAIAQLGQPGRLPVLFLDEVDRLLNHERDHGERLVGKWRTMAQEGLCHFAFFGSTGLARRQDDPQSSFFNFAQQLALGYLDRKTADMVLHEPLNTLGLQLEDGEHFLSEVFAATSGHPNLTQFIGRGLVNAVNERKERLIHREDLTALLASAPFEDFYLKTIWGEAGPLEKLITLVAPIVSDESGFSIATLSKALADEGVQADENAVAAALKMLDVYSILRREGRSYHFTPRAFQAILHRSQDVDRLIRQERSRLLNPPILNNP